MKGKGARTNLKGGLLAAEGEVIDFVTRIFHTSPGANSDQSFRAVAGRKGQTAYQGRVVVEKDAQKTEAHQSCQNLILERSGEANVKPELLIFADDVICSHGPDARRDDVRPDRRSLFGLRFDALRAEPARRAIERTPPR